MIDENLTYDGKTESDFSFKEPKEFSATVPYYEPESPLTVYVYEYNRNIFINTYSNIKKLIEEIYQANPQLKFSFEPIERKINYWYEQKCLNGLSWSRAANWITYSIEFSCVANYEVPYNPYWEMTEEEVLEIENKLRAEEGLEPVDKFFR